MAHRLSDPHLEFDEDASSLQDVDVEHLGPEERHPLLSPLAQQPQSPPLLFKGQYGSSDIEPRVSMVLDIGSLGSRRVGRGVHLLPGSSPPSRKVAPNFRFLRDREVVFKFLCLLTIVIFVVYLLFSFSVLNNNALGRDFVVGHPFFPPAIQNSWGAYTPYFSVRPYPPPPPHCTISQVNIIQRHGARFPTTGAAARIQAALEKLQSADEFLDPKMKFLADYVYSLGQNDLLQYGAAESVTAGKEAYDRYSFLISQDNLPFVRASLSPRVVDSATNWTAGFSLASNHVFNPVLSVTMDEKMNDTLDDAMCPNAGSSEVQIAVWTSIYAPPIAARLNAQAPGATLTAEDISNLIPLCAFETLAKQAPSPFCDLFTPQEFGQYEYNSDLDKYYGTGYGQSLGPVQGVGYINELLARLTETPVRDNTQTNRTLDSSPATFPLNRTLYADFSHDNQMIAIYSAMGLFKQMEPLSPRKMDTSLRRTWITSRLTPFSGRMVVERLSCDSSNSGRFGRRLAPRSVRSDEREASVRILVNDALQPLHFCGADGNGLCTLDAFVQSQAYARNDGDGDFEKCFP